MSCGLKKMLDSFSIQSNVFKMFLAFKIGEIVENFLSVIKNEPKQYFV